MKMGTSKNDADGKLKTGIVEEYCKDGTLACAGKYRNGEKVGEWKYYLRNGLLKAVGRYSNGKMTGEWKWYRENGRKPASGRDTIPMGRYMTRASTSATRKLANGVHMTTKGS